MTLIELLVAMILLAVILSTIVGVLVDTFSSSSRTAANRSALSQVADALEVMAQDLRAVRSHHRTPEFVRDAATLREWVLYGTAAKNPFGGMLDLNEFKVATPTRMAFLADVDSTLGANPELAECINYTIGGTGQTFSLTRRVNTYSTGCPDSGGRVTTLIPTQTLPTGVARPQFVYELVCNNRTPSTPAGWCRGVPLKTAGNNAECAGRMTSSLSAAGRNWITAVQFNIQSYLAYYGGATSDQAIKTAIGIRTRQNHDYYTALGCAI